MSESDRQDPIVRAGEYVLGLLDADELSVFEAELRDSDEAKRLVAYWEQRLGALGLALAPEPPPEAVWQRIVDEIGAANDASNTPSTGVAAQRTRGPGIWRGLAIAASIAALALAAVLFTGTDIRNPRPPDVPSTPAYASVIYDEPTGMSWLVTAPAGGGTLSVVAMGDYDVPSGKMLRAWFKPADSDPILLGELPHAGGRYQIKVPDTVARVIDKPAQLIVSMEDTSRAGTPTPSGKVMWISPIGRRSG